jgi:hypothetical protein
MSLKINIGRNGDKTWRNPQGQRHRTDGPAYERANGTKEWFFNDQCHRTEGPAVEWADGSKWWYVNGQRHRTDGPAVEDADGTKQWWVDDQQLTFAEWVERVADTEQERTLLLLKYG